MCTEDAETKIYMDEGESYVRTVSCSLKEREATNDNAVTNKMKEELLHIWMRTTNIPLNTGLRAACTNKEDDMEVREYEVYI